MKTAIMYGGGNIGRGFIGKQGAARELGIDTKTV